VFETAGIADRLTELRAVMAKDDTHYLEIGYKNIANRCRNCIQQIMAESKTVTKKNSYFWRGFKSPCGSSAPRLAAGHTSTGRGLVTRGVLLGGAREESSVGTGPDHTIPIRDGDPSLGNEILCKMG
jgi:hypothetical protein